MTDTDGAPTTGADFDAMLSQGLHEVFQEEDPQDNPEVLEQAPVTTQEEDEETEDSTPPESIDTGNKADQTDDSPELVADVLALVDTDDKEALKSRISDMGKGIEKLRTRDAQNASSVQWINQTFDNAVKGDSEAIKALDQAFEFRGSSLTDFAIQHLSNTLGIDPQDFKDYFPSSTVQSKPQAQTVDPKLSKLEQEVAEMRIERETQAWARDYGANMADYVEKVTGLKFDVNTLADSRSKFPAKATAQDIVDAVMQTNPKAYRAADAAKGSPDKTPNNAYVSKGGKSAPKLDASTLLNDPNAFERLIKS